MPTLGLPAEQGLGPLYGQGRGQSSGKVRIELLDLPGRGDFCRTQAAWVVLAISLLGVRAPCGVNVSVGAFGDLILESLSTKECNKI